ncbi:DUF4397 domain-containing protein [Sphingobacterium sp. lm-10]|uniref:DUF4397 domain-containing protein n=1 Tax=Sphingobacterium sp. lm-10 TaxID=2944904 RepID=UPI00202228D9|nr:DUF4397 domain-containing protein [Sphingobacterium sp. lm-10]MCL7988882.1 DUF4397 domain-containing protein [Sphingobacterium sp. lm-10]
MIKFSIYIVTFALLMTSCSNKDYLSQGSLDSSLNQMAVLAVFNGVSGSDQMDVFLNGERQNSSIEMLRYGEFMRHRTAYPGNRRLTLNIRYGNQTVSPPAVDINLVAGKNYSVLLTRGNPVQSTLVEDDLLLPRNGQFRVRFINTNADGLTVALGTASDRSRFFGDLRVGNISAFAVFDVADYQLQFATNNSTLATYDFDFKPVNQGVYTIWLTGSLAEKDRNSQTSLYTVIRHP